MDVSAAISITVQETNEFCEARCISYSKQKLRNKTSTPLDHHCKKVCTQQTYMIPSTKILPTMAYVKYMNYVEESFAK